MLEYLLKYETLINTSKNKEEIKNLVQKLFMDDNISDIDFNEIIYECVVPKLKDLGIEIPMYNEETNESCFETILREKY
jgi:hypothetical protein